MPYRPDTRQYRSFAASNFQPVTSKTVIDEDGNEVEQEPSYQVRGYFTTFNEEYLLYPAIPSMGWPAEYEQIDRNAFDQCDISDVIVQYDHDNDVLARTRNGSLKVSFDDHGGYCEMYFGGCQRARDLYESICNGLISEMSFGFVISDTADGVGYTSTRDEQGDYHTTVTNISKLYDVSIVSIPANPNTDVSEVRKRSSYLAKTIENDIKAEQEREAEERRQVEEAEEARKAERERLRRRARALSLVTV